MAGAKLLHPGNLPVLHGGFRHQCRSLGNVYDAAAHLIHVRGFRRPYLVENRRFFRHRVGALAAGILIGIMNTGILQHMLP